MIQAILFDLDGLMVDSEPHSRASWQAVMARRGVTLEPSVLDGILGQRLIETARLFVERYNLSDAPEQLSQEKEAYQIAYLNGQVKPMPGLSVLLDDVERRGLRTAVASSGARVYVQAVLDEIRLAHQFETLVTAEDVVHGKPAPDVFLLAARAVDVPPEQCLVLEDAPSGIQAAKAAGMRCVAIPHQYTRGLDLSGADWILASLADVRTILDEIGTP
jgi:HAD superfamily hydrolase (TIGR01509 family)